MSIRSFHLLFIALSVVLAAFCAAWSSGQYRLEQEMEYAVSGVGALIVGGALAFYGATFQRKTRHL
jgi:hypothetical protein